MNKIKYMIMVSVAIIIFCSCSNRNSDLAQNVNVVTATPLPYYSEDLSPTPIPDIKIELEAEDAIVSGETKIGYSQKGFSGTGYLDNFQTEEDSFTLDFDIDTPGNYNIIIRALANGERTNYLVIDGKSVGTFVTSQNEFYDEKLEHIFLGYGHHTVSMKVSWGWICLDKITFEFAPPLSADFYKIEDKLCNPNATENTKRLMSFLLDMYGNRILTGQYCENGAFGLESASVWRVTGDYPAVLGLDFSNYSPLNKECGAKATATDLAIDYWNQGGIVTFCWHWTGPSKKYVTGNWYGAFRTEESSFKLGAALDGSDSEGYDALLEGIDSIGAEILKLQSEGVPILFRPLHEASGGWFWWGADGAENYIKLYKLMYNRLVNELGCNNLIWIWNGQDADWYPGDEYVDIVGVDLYPGEHEYSSQPIEFFRASKYSGEPKMIALSENGCVPLPDDCQKNNVMWSFYATWGSDFVLKSSGFNKYSEKYTEESVLKNVYSSEYFINRSELPDIKSYPIREGFNK